VTKNRKALANKLQKKVNLYVRLRDCGDQGGCNCISCGRWKLFSEGDGGHFIPSISSAIRYDERNINFQCIACNRFKSSGRQYYKGMILKYGQAIVDELEAQEFVIKKWEYDELLERYEYFTARIKELRP
jgi:hypothetical protein